MCNDIQSNAVYLFINRIYSVIYIDRYISEMH